MKVISFPLPKIYLLQSLSGSQRWCGCRGERKNYCLCSESNPCRVTGELSRDFKQLFVLLLENWLSRDFQQLFMLLQDIWLSHDFKQLFMLLLDTWLSRDFKQLFMLLQDIWLSRDFKQLFILLQDIWLSRDFKQLFVLLEDIWLSRDFEQLLILLLDIWLSWDLKQKFMPIPRNFSLLFLNEFDLCWSRYSFPIVLELQGLANTLHFPVLCQWLPFPFLYAVFHLTTLSPYVYAICTLSVKPTPMRPVQYNELKERRVSIFKKPVSLGLLCDTTKVSR